MDNKVFLKEETVVSIADAIREKSGSNEKMTPAQMAVRIQNLTVGGSEDLIDDLNAIHGEEAKSTAEEAVTTIEEVVGEQTDLISQIQTALVDKAAGEGGGESAALENCTVTLDTREAWVYYQSVIDGVPTAMKDESLASTSGVLTLNVQKNTLLLLVGLRGNNYTSGGFGEEIFSENSSKSIIVVGRIITQDEQILFSANSGPEK